MDFTLRKFRESDLESLVKYAGNYRIARFMTNGFPHPYTEEDGRRLLSAESKNTDIFAIDVNGEAVGSIGIFPQTDIHEKNAEIGYWLAEPFWGKGIMTRAIKEISEYGFKTYGITRIFARPFSTNPASQRVLEKAGFTCEARLKDVLYKNGSYMDELIYAIRKNKTDRPVISAVPKTAYSELMEVWEASVRATHHFLKEEDIVLFRKLIPEKYLDAVRLYAAHDANGSISGFLGVSDDTIEMLFIRPDARGAGIGSALLGYAVNELHIRKVDVNEQNGQAVGFYLHKGFTVAGRSERDGTGKPYPILHLKIE